MAATAYATHSDYQLHTLEGHPEHAGRIQKTWQVFGASGVLDDLMVITPPMATVEQLTRVHDPRYINHLEKAAERGGGMLDPDTYMLPISYDVARLSAGGCIAVVDAILSGKARNGLAAVRPPGHHATPVRAMGFCMLSNIAIAARHAQAAYPTVKKVMIVDYDVHHGNGTQDTFYADPNVLFVSTHQYPFYPGSGAINEIGEGDGRGATLNMPLRAGVGPDGFALLYEKILWPAARRYRPDLILVSAGFDAHWADPLAMLQLDLRGYVHLTRELIKMAEELCDGRIAFVMEGGYDLDAISHGLLNVAYALLGKDAISDPLGDLDMPQQGVDALVEQLRALHQLG